MPTTAPQNGTCAALRGTQRIAAVRSSARSCPLSPIQAAIASAARTSTGSRGSPGSPLLPRTSAHAATALIIPATSYAGT
ncbi:hypothetical protein [Streptomyces sp. NPDC059468]|uniref:hypothetical protein n=1 Tax=unclassified Streptomyces TaxID=2593676 RepID=UPI003675E045